MTDTLSANDRTKTMRAVKGSRTSIERKLWSMLAGMRLCGWRCNAQDVPGRPDAVFDKEMVAIFVDGCFWHRCPVCRRPMPKTNADYWKRKIDRNVERDKKIDKSLSYDGWEVVRIWEHEIKDKSLRKAVNARFIEALNT